MAKKRPAKKRPAKETPATSKSAEAEMEAHEEELVLAPGQDKSLKLVEKSAKVRAELEGAVTLAITKAVRKCMKDNKIELTLPEASMLAAIWFGDEE